MGGERDGRYKKYDSGISCLLMSRDAVPGIFHDSAPSTVPTFGSAALRPVAFRDGSDIKLAADPCVGGCVADLL